MSAPFPYRVITLGAGETHAVAVLPVPGLDGSPLSTVSLCGRERKGWDLVEGEVPTCGTCRVALERRLEAARGEGLPAHRFERLDEDLRRAGYTNRERKPCGHGWRIVATSPGGGAAEFRTEDQVLAALRHGWEVGAP